MDQGHLFSPKNGNQTLEFCLHQMGGGGGEEVGPVLFLRNAPFGWCVKGKPEKSPSSSFFLFFLEVFYLAVQSTTREIHAPNGAGGGGVLVLSFFRGTSLLVGVLKGNQKQKEPVFFLLCIFPRGFFTWRFNQLPGKSIFFQPKRTPMFEPSRG